MILKSIGLNFSSLCRPKNDIGIYRKNFRKGQYIINGYFFITPQDPLYLNMYLETPTVQAFKKRSATAMLYGFPFRSVNDKAFSFETSFMSPASVGLSVVITV